MKDGIRNTGTYAAGARATKLALLVNRFRSRIPQYRVEVRDPVTGWQAVWVGHDEKEAISAYQGWVTMGEDQFDVTLKKCSGWQSWLIVKSHDGLYLYER